MDVHDAPERLRTLPSWLLAQATLAAGRLVGERLAAAGAHRSHFALLAALDEAGPASQADLGRRIGLDRSDMVALLDDLTARSLVRRDPDPADRRRNIVSLTTAGARQLLRLDDVVAGAQDELLAGLSERERTQLVRLLGRLLSGVSPTWPGGTPRGAG